MPQSNGSSPKPPHSPVVAAWARQGRYRTLGGHRVFTVDRPPDGEETAEPLLVLHGFPTSSFDFHLVLDGLARGRRVLLLDFVGFGLSAKPDLAYTIDLQANAVMDFMAEEGIERFALLTHDMGDTIGGELLARQADGVWPVDISRRVLANGSIYIEMAHLSTGQQLLLSLPDQLLAAEALDRQSVTASLMATFATGARVPDDELAALWELLAFGDGQRVMPRTIRYIEERRLRQHRYTGAIERHPSPLTVVWGAEDPIAVAPMVSRLQESRPDVTVHWLDGVGHYPMLEAPERFLTATLAGLA